MSSVTPNLADVQENTPTVFNFGNDTIRILLDEKQTPLFVAKDVAKALGYADTVNAIKKHCKGVAKHHLISDSLGRTQNVRVIYEPDVYRLIFGSKLKSAIQFQDWVFEQVLPQIRQTGQYGNYQLIAQFERACIEFEHLTQLASNAGRTLCVVGKRLKPNAQQKVLSLQNKIQPQLALGENHHE